ncbi:ABC-type glycerol-3-phosphate transport system substrate-binding protein [Thermocatellispora tengchongensis]|uniref:ABC-type glycerol-3-phosphate transport system substrate-binding protein n=1 Tax=Thermocatellispora tengchongensis TaxID=1073253 RepID=A0A840PIW9_9ACTN|nr:extracellular solute-binding protein [Thermocatellispora tengchongensis]MBB5138919.1 ABC-type glycerol-3-phosphate transport system substrate-binding protein [Thermocatellispora tengchongensis]
MRSHFRSLSACALVAVLTVAGAGCGQDAETAQGGVTTITVMGMPAATNAKGRKLFQDQVAAFEKANPGIKVVGSDMPWDVKTFAPMLAGGSAPTVLRVPLTEPAGLIERRQVADITKEATALAEYRSLNPDIMSYVTRNGVTYGLPEKAYALGLAYNRALFAKAGLDPDKPPATWDDVRAYAKQIKDKTGAVGFGEITTNNSGGWHLTAYTYSEGGSMIEQAGGRWTAAFNGDAARRVLDRWRAMRWEDDSMGGNVLGKQEDMIAQFAAGKIGMWVTSPSDIYPTYVTNGGKPEDFGAGPMPQGAGSATLVGGTIHMVNAKATPEQRAAAVKWIQYRYLRPNFDTEAAVATAKAAAADGTPVGVPVLPIFDQATADKIYKAIAPHANVPQDHFAAYVASLGSLTFTPEPQVASQEIYAALDPVAQAVLTRRDADPAALLADAETRVNAILGKQQ